MLSVEIAIRGCESVVGVNRCEGCVENAIAKSPLPFEYVDPVRAIAKTARAAMRSRLRASTGAFVATTIMQEPSAKSADPVVPDGDSAFHTGTPAIVSL